MVHYIHDNDTSNDNIEIVSSNPKTSESVMIMYKKSPRYVTVYQQLLYFWNEWKELLYNINL